MGTPAAQSGLGGLAFPLASDVDGTVCQAYGAYLPRPNAAQRALFIIDPNGVLQYSLVHSLSIGRSTDELLRVLDALQTGGLCPSDWTAGQPSLHVSQVLQPNHVVGQYLVQSLLGEGSFGSVFRATDLLLERTVALKVMRSPTAETVERVLAEARAAAALNHPNVGGVYGVETSLGTPIIVLEYIEGEPLSRHIERGPIPFDTASRWGRQIANGMAAAHAAGIAHGDLKPANVVVSSEGNAKIMDFGLAIRRKAASPTDATVEWKETSGISGTPSYLAPEQIQGDSATPVSDIFAMGLILFEMLVGRKAIDSNSLIEAFHQIQYIQPEQIAAELPDPFQTLVRRALEPNPDRRSLTMNEIHETLA